MSQRKATALALAALAVLAAAVIAVWILARPEHRASQGTVAQAYPTLQATEPAADQSSAAQSAPSAVGAVVPSDAAVQAHTVMIQYLEGLASYSYRTTSATWAAPLKAMTNGSSSALQDTALPTGHAWAECVAQRCTSSGVAAVIEDTDVADNLVSGSGATISSLVGLKTTVTGSGGTTTTTTEWTVQAVDTGSGWQIAGISVAGVGDSGTAG